jgi:hypothetical protein
MSLQTLSKDIQLSAILQITVALGQKRPQWEELARTDLVE